MQTLLQQIVSWAEAHFTSLNDILSSQRAFYSVDSKTSTKNEERMIKREEDVQEEESLRLCQPLSFNRNQNRLLPRRFSGLNLSLSLAAATRNTTVSIMIKLWRWYQRCLTVHPLKTQVISSGFLWGFGDVTAQYITHSTAKPRLLRLSVSHFRSPSLYSILSLSLSLLTSRLNWDSLLILIVHLVTDLMKLVQVFLKSLALILHPRYLWIS